MSKKDAGEKKKHYDTSRERLTLLNEGDLEYWSGDFCCCVTLAGSRNIFFPACLHAALLANALFLVLRSL
jgi:hypothetical protein